MFGKLKEKICGSARKITIGVVATALAVGSAIPAFAEDASTGGVATMMGTAFGTVQTDFMSAVAVIAPIALGIFGVFLIWKYGKKIWHVIAG